MTDIVERLRHADWEDFAYRGLGAVAADEIERLRDAIAQLAEQLDQERRANIALEAEGERLRALLSEAEQQQLSRFRAANLEIAQLRAEVKSLQEALQSVVYEKAATMTEQQCYDLGYDNPDKPPQRFAWNHVVEVNAFRCGQLDRQNQAPRNADYRREDYDPDTFERKPPPIVEIDDAAEPPLCS